MMFQQVPIFLGIILFITHSSSIGIDDKLDFGGPKNHPQAYRGTHRPVSYKSSVTKIALSDHVDGTGVVCGSGGCNKTNPNDNIFETDVVVHIETKVDANQNVSEPVGDTPDVPVVIGFNSEPDQTNDEKPRLHQKSIYVSEPEPTGSGSPGYPSTSGMSISPTNQLFYPSHSDRRMDYGVVGIKIKTLPPDNTQDNLLASLAVPYFEPSQHTHNFGEVPSPQHAWYARKGSVFNPVEFKTMRPSVWKPSVWHKTVAPLLRQTSYDACVCQDGRGHTQTGLRWYPSESRRVSEGKRFGNGDPGSQINDKLASLN